MAMAATQLKGYTLPLSPGGSSSLVPAPPWFFGGDAIEVAFNVDIDQFRRFLPHPFSLSDNPGLACVTIIDMTSVSNADTAFAHPEQSQYRECLIKLHCTLDDKPGWYVPITWVDTDFALVRGFIQGFGKKLGKIQITNLHDLNPMIGGKRPGARMKAICEVFNGIHIELALQLDTATDDDAFAGTTPSGTSMYVTRHFPDIENPEHPVIHEVSELVVRGGRKADIWKGTGSVIIQRGEGEEINDLQPREIVGARCFREGFELVGGRILYRY